MPKPNITCRGFEPTTAINLAVSDCMAAVDTKHPLQSMDAVISKDGPGEFKVSVGCKTICGTDFHANMTGEKVYQMIKLAGSKISRQISDHHGRMVSKRGVAKVMPEEDEMDA